MRILKGWRIGETISNFLRWVKDRGLTGKTGGEFADVWHTSNETLKEWYEEFLDSRLTSKVEIGDPIPPKLDWVLEMNEKIRRLEKEIKSSSLYQPTHCRTYPCKEIGCKSACRQFGIMQRKLLDMREILESGRGS